MIEQLTKALRHADVVHMHCICFAYALQMQGICKVCRAFARPDSGESAHPYDWNAYRQRWEWQRVEPGPQGTRYRPNLLIAVI